MTKRGEVLHPVGYKFVTSAGDGLVRIEVIGATKLGGLPLAVMTIRPDDAISAAHSLAAAAALAKQQRASNTSIGIAIEHVMVQV